MKIFPYEKYELKSSASLEELYASIDKGCEPWKISANFGEISKPLFGKRCGNKFRLYRASSNKNAFQPVAFGTIYDNGEEVLVEVTLRMNMFVILFAVVWLSFTFTLIFAYSLPITPSLVLIGMIVCGYLLIQGGFWFEVPRIKKLISNIVTLRIAA